MNRTTKKHGAIARQIAAVFLLTICVASGCRRPTGLDSNLTDVRRTSALKVHAGMSESEANAVLGVPFELRMGHGLKDDVAIYDAGDGRLTVYFFHNKLTRVVSSRIPVNR